MKGFLGETGTLIVQAENDLEAYALDRWADDYFGEQKSIRRPASFIVSPTVDRAAATKQAEGANQGDEGEKNGES